MSKWRIAGFVGLGIVGVLAVVAGSVVALSDRAFNRTYAVDPPPMEVVELAGTNGGSVGTNGGSASPTGALVARGEHLHRIRGCADCHGENAGGGPFSEDPVVGLLWASNLTSGEGGAAASYTDQDWDRSIRHGIGPDYKPLLFMPAHEFWPLSDEDLSALIAYYRNVEPVDWTAPEPDIGPIGRILYLTGQLPLVPAELVDHEAERPPAPPMGPTVEYGGYLATGCVGCHGQNLTGGKIVGGDPNWPPAKNITPHEETGIGAWSFEDFDVAMRTGVRPDGSEINPIMPIKATKHFTDVEMRAVYEYLMSLDPLAYNTR